MNPSQRLVANKIVDLIYRKKILIISLVLLSLPVGLAVYLQSPKLYMSSCLLSYQQQKISPNKLSPDLEGRTYDIVNTLSKIVTSRTNLESLIKNLDLYPELRENLPDVDLIDKLISNIKISPSKRGNTFYITYTDSDPERAVKVANALAASFIEENLKYRQERATETSSYANEEMQRAKEVMDKKDQALRDYKLKNYNEMPEQRSINMSALGSLQDQYQRKQDSIQDLERTLVLIQDQVNERLAVLKRIAESGVDEENSSSKKEQLFKARSKLESVLRRYTEKHPEVKRLRRLIAKLENETKLEAGNDADSEIAKQSYALEDPTLKKLRQRQENVSFNIASLKNEQEQLKRRISEYEAWIAAAPAREAEWNALTREYKELKRHYDYLVSRDLEAKSMLYLERSQKGSQFRIEDLGRLPEKPIEPNFWKIMGICLIIGLGSGVGLIVVLDFFDGSFRDPDQLESMLGISLMATIPFIATDDERKKFKIRQVMSFSGVFLGTCLIVAMFVYVWVEGKIVL